MQFEAALTEEQGVTFVVVSVKPSAMHDSAANKDALRATFSSIFDGVPTVLMAVGTGQIYGRPDIVRFLQNVHPAQLPWKKWTYN